MPKFELDAAYRPTADQPQAIAALAEGILAGERFLTLLGATGTGKTMTMAGVIEAVQKPTLVIAHNKTLAAQLCNEFRTYFPRNAVEDFVSYYDYYQPEAYVPSKDLYIEKDSAINQEIDRLRHSATAALFARRDVVIVASVSCIYGLGSPEVYEMNFQTLSKGAFVDRDELLRKLVSIQYSRNDTALSRGTFRVRGETLEVFPAYAETAYRVVLFGDEVELLQEFDPLTGEILRDDIEHVGIWPATHYNVREGMIEEAVAEIGRELEQRCAELEAQGKLLESHRLRQRTSTTWRCCARSASARGSRTTRGSSMGALPASARTACSTTFPTISSASSTSLTRPCLSLAACTRVTARASRPSSTTASACRAPSTTAPRPSRSSSRSRRRSCSSRPRRASTSAPTRRGSWSRSCARPGSSTLRSRCARPATRSMI